MYSTWITKGRRRRKEKKKRKEEEKGKEVKSGANRQIPE